MLFRSNILVRSIGAVVAGVIAWPLTALTIILPMLLVWPGFSFSQARQAPDPFDLFTTDLQAAFLIVYLFAATASGWITVYISKQRNHARYVAALLAIYLSANHLYLEWDAFPPWYNWLVVLPVIPMVLYGGKLVPINNTSNTNVTTRTSS